MIGQMKKYPLANQSGLTMIELMIAMLLGLVVIGGVAQIFISSKQTYNLQEAQSRIQENGRLAMNFLPYNIRLADFQGCRSRQQYTTANTNIIANPEVCGPGQFPPNCPPDPSSNAPDLDLSLWDLNGGITGTNNAAAGTTIGTLAVVTGTDIINLQFGGSCGGRLVNNMAANNAPIQINVNNTCNLKQNWPFMITDCVDTDIVRRSNVIGDLTIETVAPDVNNVNIGTKLSKAYQSDAEIFSIQSITYFIAQNTIGNNSLYRRDNAAGTSEEMVEGVQDMQILYGEDTNLDKTPDYYVDAATVAGMQNVVSVKVSLLLQSMSDVNVTSKPITYTYNGRTYNVPGTTAPTVDNQLRKVFSSTVTLRNRLP